MNEHDKHMHKLTTTLNDVEIMIDRLIDLRSACIKEIKRLNSEPKHTVDQEILNIREEISRLIQSKALDKN